MKHPSELSMWDITAFRNGGENLFKFEKEQPRKKWNQIPPFFLMGSFPLSKEGNHTGIIRN